jgi:8-oxo-dGTP pyrophosphatase MutT (NUDIX family)
MIKIFFNDRLLVLSDNWEQSLSNANATACKITKKSDIVTSVNYFFSAMRVRTLHLVVENVPDALAQMQAMFAFLEAAGGVVYNAAGDVLMIYRNDRWDLPKGRREANESVEETALREVEEECGISDLQLQQLITKTYHLYSVNKTMYMKCTHWFKMYYGGTARLVPQTNEGIKWAEWISPSNLPMTLTNVYASIYDVFVKLGVTG